MKPFPAKYHWRPTMMIKGSFLLIVTAVTAVAISPDIWPWAASIVVLDHLLLTIAGLWPRSTLLGSNWISLPEASAAKGEIAITIDDGPDPVVTPAVLDLLDSYGVKATFFCIGEKAQRHPDLCRDIVNRGHAVENHSMHHNHHFSFLLLGGYYSELADAQQTLTSITGIRPGEKLHEVLVNEDEARHTLELDDMYVVQPLFPWWTQDHWADGRELPDGFRFGSDTNTCWLSKDELRAMIEAVE